MPWRVTDPMLEKTRFVLAVEAEEGSFAELCEGFGIARETGYRWWRRYKEAGLAGLADRSRRPKRSPSATTADAIELLLQARQRKRTWGAAKLLDRLRKKHPEIGWPSDTTGHRILKRHGLVEPRSRRAAAAGDFPGTGAPFAAALAPNSVWTVDFKGQFRLGNRQWCYPLTLQDLYSRYGLACRALPSTSTGPARKVFTEAFHSYGLPDRIRSDNGAPFASTGLLGLSELSIWLLKLGIHIERIAPGQPQQNGHHERYHRTLKQETTLPPEHTFRAQQERFNTFLQEYNHDRPHEALHMAVPAEYYTASTRQFPRRNEWPGLDYPETWERRQVRHNGMFKWRGREAFVSVRLRGETIALQPVGTAVSLVRFSSLILGVLREDNTFVPA